MKPLAQALSVRRWMWVVWPAFLVAGLIELLVFAFVDPHDVRGLGGGVPWPYAAIYSLSFLAFWALAMLSSALTLLLSTAPSTLELSPAPKAHDTQD